MDVTWYVVDRIRWRLKDRAYGLLRGDGKLHHYPSEIRQLVGKIQPHFAARDAWFAKLPTTGWSAETGPALESWPLPLATYSLRLHDLNWLKNDLDVEDVFALHRFTWLLRWVALRPHKEHLKTGDELILDWIDQIGPQKDMSAWETYSASERVVNWLLYFSATKESRSLDSKIAAIILRSINEHLLHISRHLEYYGGAANNHSLNDARALYIGGRLLGLSSMADLGRTLFQRHTPLLVDEDGALLEDSTHYQLLLTRTFAEVLWAARITSDESFVRSFEPVARSMMGCCLSISREVPGTLDENFPRVGDLSPDFPLFWFCPGRPQEEQTGSWRALWGSEKLSSLMDEGDSVAERSPAEWKWVSDPTRTYRIMVHTPRYAHTYPRGHGHLDFGSFSLYSADGPLLVDRGRYSYRPDDLGVYGFSAQAHNTTLINGQPLLPNSTGLFRGYREIFDNATCCQIENGDQESKVAWRTRAVSRLFPSLGWTRNVLLTPHGVDMSEEISNSERADISIESYFHWANGWKLRPDIIKSGVHYQSVVTNGEQSYYFTVEHSFEEFEVEWLVADNDSGHGWHFPDYGRKIPALTLRVLFRTSRDCAFQFSIRPV